MKIYLDIVILLNFIIDFLLIISVNIILKRGAKTYRIVLSSLLGTISAVIFTTGFGNIYTFLFKLVTSIFMVLLAFGYKNIKYFFNNTIYLYLLSIILGGFLYLINDSFKINIIIVILSAPIIFIFYIIQVRKQKEVISNTYDVEITFLNGKKSCLTGFLDTGNNLTDPYKKRPVIIINSKVIKNYEPNVILVPFVTLNGHDMMRCFKIKKLVINDKKIEDEVLVGISDNNFNLEGVDLLLNNIIVRER